MAFLTLQAPICSERERRLRLQLLHSLVHFLAIETAKFSDFTCIQRLTSLFHSCQYFVFYFHND